VVFNFCFPNSMERQHDTVPMLLTSVGRQQSYSLIYMNLLCSVFAIILSWKVNTYSLSMTVFELMIGVVHIIPYTWHYLLDLLLCLSWFQRTCVLYLGIQRCNRKLWSQTCLVQWRISCELGGDTSSPARQEGRSVDSVTVQYNHNLQSKN
jgi:hypothetical protein